MSELTLIQKFNQAKKRLTETELNKSGKNTFQKYEYFELGDFITDIIQLEHELNFANIISFPTIDGTTTALLTIADGTSDKTLSFASPIADASTKGASPIQAIGSMHTYMRRYLYVLAYEIAEHDAVDGKDQDTQEMPAGTKVLPKIDLTAIQKEVQEMLYPNARDGKLGDANGCLYEIKANFMKKYGYQKTSQMSPQEWVDLRDVLLDSVPVPFGV